MKTVIIGASGATGKELVYNLLNDASFNAVTVLVRKPLEISHSKLKQITINFDELEKYQNEINGDLAFSCLGTTLKTAGSKEKQWKIDFDYQYNFAKIARENNIPTFVLLSSVGANANSKFFYTKMKGKLDEAVKNLNFERTIILQPGNLIRPNTDRFGEKISVSILNFFNSIRILKNYKPLHVKQIAECLKYFGINSEKGFHIIKMPQILRHLNY